MDEFLIFVAPFLLLLLSIGAAFWVAKDDQAVREGEE